MNLLFQAQNLMTILRFRKRFNADCMKAFGSVVLIASIYQSAAAATLYVNPGGTSGAYSTIAAAVAKASAGDTIYVAPGTGN